MSPRGSVIGIGLLALGIGVGAVGCVGDASPSLTNDGGPSTGTGGGAQPDGGTGSGTGGSGTGSSSGSGGGSGSSSGTGTGGSGSGSSSGTGTGGAVSTTNPLLPARIRRLTNAEYDASVRALLGSPSTMAPMFPPDSRQGIFARGGYTLNDAQRVDPVLAKQLSDSATAAVAEARSSGRLANLAPCSNATSGGEACAKTFITSFGAKAYRRALTDAESTALLTVYKTGANGGTYNDGIDLAVQALLQSAGFLYITEIGAGATPGTADVMLTNDEGASVLSYLLAASPPDDTLLNMARSGGLVDAAGRETQARRLLGTKAGQDAMVRFVREMFSLDQMAVTDKDTTAYPDFAAAKTSIVNETNDFVREVLTKSTGTIGELLSADWTIADATLAKVYGATSAGTSHTSLAASKRRGILNQAGFLSVFAHASESGPVLRGVAIMRQVACMPLKSPTELNIDVTPPPFDSSKTMRQRFTDHAADPKCSACHKNIDAFGFSFETYDGMGAARKVVNGKPTENNQTVDTAVTLATGLDFDGTYADSNALAVALSTSAQVRNCLARQIFRSSTGRSDASVTASEEAFVNFWKQLPADKQGNVLETLVSYVKNPTFLKRRPQ
jgi:hypothetical protein